MKKTILIISSFLLAGALSASAQITIKDKTLSWDEGITGLELGTTIGMNTVSPMGVSKAFGSDIRIPLVGATFLPFGEGFELSGDFAVGKTATRLSDKRQFYDGDGTLLIIPQVPGIDYRKSIVRNAVLSSSIIAGVPIGGKVELFCGIQGEFNFDGTAVNKFKMDGKRDKVKLHDVKTTPWTYSYKAGIYFGDFGVYFRLSPCKALEAGRGPQWERCAIGITLR